MDFGYPWWMTYGHLALGLPAALAAIWLARRKRLRAVKWVSVLIAVWATAAFAVVKFGFRLDAPIRPPTSRFLAGGSGRVLDLGCGSGRASIGLLRARKQATVVGLDNWSAKYIQGNGPDLFLANARAAGVLDRISAQSADMRELPFGDGSFAAVISAYAIDHLDGAGIRRALAEAARVLRPGGEVLIINMNQDAWTVFAYTPLMALHSAGPSRSAGSGHGVAAPGHGGAAAGDHSPEEVWRIRLERAGLEMVEVGRRPGTLFFLARKPGGAEPAPR